METKKIKIFIIAKYNYRKELLQFIIKKDESLELSGIAERHDEVIRHGEDVDVFIICIENLSSDNAVSRVEKILSLYSKPVIIVADIKNPENKKNLLNLMAKQGATYFINMPSSKNHADYEYKKTKLIKTIKILSTVKMVTRKKNKIVADAELISKKTIEINPELRYKKPHKNKSENDCRNAGLLIAIGASTGGPKVVKSIISSLPADFPYPIVIIQHMLASYADRLAEYLTDSVNLPVTTVTDQQSVKQGNIYLPAGGCHLVLTSKRKLRAFKEEAGVIPSVDIFFESLVKYYKKNCVAILLTGMGKDGAKELKAIKDAGAITIAQSPETCVVFGMPGEAVKINAATYVMTPEEIINYLITLI